jgi:hypothetical protein
MNIGIDRSIIEQESIGNLRRLLYAILNKKGSSLLLDNFEEDDVRQDLSEDEKDMMKAAFVNTIRESLKPDCQVKTGSEREDTKKEFSLEEAIRYLKQPLGILVENNLTDPHLLRAIFRSYFGRENLLDECERNNELRYENAGGCANMGNWLKAELERWGNRTKFLRLFVIIDSDKRFPNDPFSHAWLPQQFDQYGIPYHVWHKRSMENYLPVQAYPTSSAQIGQWVRAYESLTPEQRDYYCVAEGFKKDFNTKDAVKFTNSDIAAFYGTVGAGNYQILLAGCPMGNFKTTFPALFDEARYVNRKSLDEVTSHQSHPDELKRLAERLKRLI